MNKKPILIIFLFATFQVAFAQIANRRVVTTAVPFLSIPADARASALGDQGVATSSDAFSNYWNPAKYAFASNDMGAAISYTPYLNKIVNDIFLADLTYFRAIDDRSSWAVGLRYFSLGEIPTGLTAEQIQTNPLVLRPNEFSLDASYALKLSENFSMAIQGRFINSDLKLDTGTNESTAASTVAVGVSGFYESFEVPYSNFSGIWRAGFNLSNIGPKLKYEDEGAADFIPTNLRLGGGFDFIFDSYNKLAVSLELSKLLVPSPSEPITDNEGNIIGYEQPEDVGVLAGIFKSFGEIYFSLAYPEAIKAWHLHKETYLNYACISGTIKLVLFDDRPDSKTKNKFQEIILSTKNYFLVTVPPLIWNGFTNIGKDNAILANCSTVPYSDEEIIRKSPYDKLIPYKWR